jgi:hypothetical protein
MLIASAWVIIMTDSDNPLRSNVLEYIMATPQSPLKLMVRFCNNLWLWDLIVAECKDPAKLASVKAMSKTDGFFFELCTALIQFWKRKDSVPTSHQASHVECTIKFIKALDIVLVTSEIFLPDYISSVTAILENIRGSDISIICEILQDVICSEGKTLVDPGIKMYVFGIWKRNIINLSKTQLDIMEIISR